jgi:hypothetical protein
MGRVCSTRGGKRNAYMILLGNPEEKRPLRRPSRKREDNIKVEFR